MGYSHELSILPEPDRSACRRKDYGQPTFVVTFRPSDTSVHVYQISEFIPITDVIIYSIALHQDYTLITEVFSVFNTYDSTLTSTTNAANARIAGNFANKFAVTSNFSSFSVPFTHDDKSITFTVNCSGGYLFTIEIFHDRHFRILTLGNRRLLVKISPLHACPK